MKQSKNYYLGLDIGTTKVCAAVCEVQPDQSLRLLGVGTSLCAGIQKGGVSDPKLLHKSVGRAVSRAEQESGCTVDKVLVNVPSMGLDFMHNTGVFISKDESGQISHEDRLDCVKRSKNVALSSEKTLLHAIPLEYRVEGTVVKNPVGVFGKSLELNTHLVLSNAALISQLSLVLKECGFYINGMMFDALAQSRVLLSDSEKHNGAVLLDMGGLSTTVSVFKAGMLMQSFVLPLGSDHLTRDISTCLSVAVPEAERLKILYGNVDLVNVNTQDSVEISSSKDGRKQIKLYLLGQIIQARLKEMFKLIGEQVPVLTDPAYTLVLGGGGCLLRGLMPFCKQQINPNVREGLPEASRSLVDSSAYSVAVGMVLYGVYTSAICYASEKRPLLVRCREWATRFSR